MKITVDYCECVVKGVFGENDEKGFKNFIMLDTKTKKECKAVLDANKDNAKICDCEHKKITVDIPVADGLNITATLCEKIGIHADFVLHNPFAE